MKRLYSLILSLGCMLAVTAQPILVGHRGSYYGVESTAEAFRNGADRGFMYLETDVKVTKDGKFVLSHDDDNTRLGGTHTINSSTLAELQSDLLTQTRGGVKYTGHMCSLDEYLDICNEKNVRPLIELKWATGINNNDFSKIPSLISAIEAKGFRNKCIILTSMKPCLEYIRTNYPDITLQFLTGQYWASHFDWCVQHGIDVDIQAGYFDKNTVKKFHNEGLKVNMWTTNSESGYKTYGNMGCDFITTDYLDGHNLPELDPEVTFPPNTLDYPENNAAVKDRYTMGAPIAAHTFDGAKQLRRAVFDGSMWYTLATDGTLSAVAADGTLKPMNTAEGKIADIAMSADGRLIGAYMNTSYAPRLMKWNDAAATPELIFAPDDDAVVPAIERNYVIAVSGKTSASMKVYVGDDNVSCITGLELAAGATDAVTETAWLSTGTADLKGSALVVTPSSRDNVLVLGGAAAAPAEFTLPWGGDLEQPKQYAAMTALPDGYRNGDGVVYFRYGVKVYMIMPVETDGKMLPALYDVTTGIANMRNIKTDCENGVEPGQYAAVGFKILGENNIVVSLLTDKGFATWKFDEDQTRVSPDPYLNLVLERTWVRSNVNGNMPEHIDGTNAQQGTAVNGIFYVNDCADKLIYVFDSTGCIGSIPGGAGWGCCRDDAGNIIVRDDKATSGTHKFIIYPAGAMPGNYGEPVSLEVTMPLAGQTNFINASGDVLGEGGMIYLFPNKQTAVNVVCMANGAVEDVRQSSDLSLTGSAAGYVLPMGNDAENWIYQIRGTGFYYYRGGQNESCLITRASTTAPGRNSTGGGAWIMCGGNEILVHNSGANYLGGFSVRDLSMDRVYASVEPIGDVPYKSDGTGNSSTFNWLFSEQNGEADYTLYQYCPANGMAVYRLYDPVKSGVNNIAVAAGTLSVHKSGTTLTATADGQAVCGLTLYTTDGRVAARTTGATLDTSALSGLYILATPAGSCKVAL